jgi:hypothetical protein
MASTFPRLDSPRLFPVKYLKCMLHDPILPKTRKTALRRELEQLMALYCSKMCRTSDSNYHNVLNITEVICNKLPSESNIQTLNCNHCASYSLKVSLHFLSSFTVAYHCQSTFFLHYRATQAESVISVILQLLKKHSLPHLTNVG